MNGSRPGPVVHPEIQSHAANGVQCELTSVRLSNDRSRRSPCGPRRRMPGRAFDAATPARYRPCHAMRNRYPRRLRPDGSRALVGSDADPRADRGEVRRPLHPRVDDGLGVVRRADADRLRRRRDGLADGVVAAWSPVRGAHDASSRHHLGRHARVWLALNGLERDHRGGGRTHGRGCRLPGDREALRKRGLIVIVPRRRPFTRRGPSVRAEPRAGSRRVRAPRWGR